MGRPLRKDVNGVDVIGTFTGDSGIKVGGLFTADTGVARTDYYVVKQRGAKTYVVTRDGTNFFTGTLKNGTPTVDGEIQMVAYLLGGADASATNLAKLTKRVATDFSGNRYTWQLTNSVASTADQIELVAI
jgi:hypothetical protein